MKRIIVASAVLAACSLIGLLAGTAAAMNHPNQPGWSQYPWSGLLIGTAVGIVAAGFAACFPYED